MYSPDKFDGTASIPSSSTSLVALVRSTTDFDVSNIVVADPWSNILNLASGNIVGNFSITAGKDRSQGLSKEAKSGLTER